MQLPLMNAAAIAAQSYSISARIAAGDVPVEVKAHLDRKGAQAFILDHGVLVIPGTNELLDWFKNFDVYRIAERVFGPRDQARGNNGVVFHEGFLRHASIVNTFAQKHDVRFIIGHSLGAAATQILATSMNVPGIGFASPRTKRGMRLLKNEEKVLNICRLDDLVTRVPPSEAGFRRLGVTVRIAPKETNPGMDHSMQNYINVLNEHAGRPDIPDRWPM